LSCNCLGIVQNGSRNHGLFRTKRPKKIRKFPQVDHRLGLESSGYTRVQYKIIYILYKYDVKILKIETFF
jgi:hypothetical protein